MQRTGAGRLRAALAVLALLAGCGAGEEAATTSTTAAATTTSASTAPPTTAVGTTASSSPSPSVTTASAGPVVLEGKVLRLTSGPARTVEVDVTEGGAARTALTAVLGKPIEDADAECPSGPTRTIRWGALTAYLSNGVLAGWFVRDDGRPALKSDKGIGIGSTRDALKKAYPDVRVETSSLGEEFSTRAGLNGVLDGKAASAKVEALFSGDACLQR